MSTGIYLIDHPPATRQFRSPRREKPSGVVVVHTAEWLADQTGPDFGAENTAAFIARRTNPGSYHDLADSDSIIQLVRYSDEAFHDATGSNPHSYGVSAAAQAAKWLDYSSTWRNATVTNMARAAARYARWLRSARGIVIPARRITRVESEARRPGFISHAERDPDRRTDPGKTFPWTFFLLQYSQFLNGDDDVNLTDTIKLFPSDSHVKYSDTQTTVGGILASTNYYTLYARNVALQNAAEIAELQAAVAALAARVDIDPAELAAIRAEAKAGALEALDEEIQDARVELVIEEDTP